MHVTSGYVWTSASCPHLPTLVMNYEWRRMRSKFVVFSFMSPACFSPSIFTIYLISVHLTFTRVEFLRCSFSAWQYKSENGARDQGAEHAAARVSDLQSYAWQWTYLLFVPKISLHSLNFSASTSHQWSGFLIHYSFKCCMFQISSFGNFLSALEAQQHIFLDLSLLLTLDLTLSTSCFHLFCPSHLHQHFCLLMNKWMRLKHWNLHTHTHELLLQHVAHITGGFKDFMSSISCECLLTINSSLFYLWGLNSVKEFSQDYCYF